MLENNKSVILSIESSASTCGVALSQNDELLCEYCVFVPNLHDKLLANMVAAALSDMELKVDELDCLALSSGPGSFTGLRIGAALAKGICFENKPKLIAVPTLEAIAFSLQKHAAKCNAQQILTLAKSHKDIYYYQIFDTEAKAKSDLTFCDLEQISYNPEENLLLCGSFEEEEILDFFQKKANKNAKIQATKGIFPRYIAKLAYKMFQEEKFTLSEDFAPLYVQDFQPKISKKK